MKITSKQYDKAVEQIQEAVNHYVEQLRIEGKEKEADRLERVYDEHLETVGNWEDEVCERLGL